MIRFGVVLTVVLTAMGLLVGGVLANSLLVVYLAIGTAALSGVLLLVGVVFFWREEVFGASPAGQPDRTVQGGSQAPGPSPALAAAGASPAGRSIGAAADDMTAVGAAAAHGDLAMEPSPAVLPPRRDVWIRGRGKLGDDPALHATLLAYVSDFFFLVTSLLPHGVSWLTPGMQVASLDHAMWFHRAFRADEWLLYVQDSPSASGARGFNRGLIYTREGALVASVAQEGLIRLRTEAAK